MYASEHHADSAHLLIKAYTSFIFLTWNSNYSIALQTQTVSLVLKYKEALIHASYSIRLLMLSVDIYALCEARSCVIFGSARRVRGEISRCFWCCKISKLWNINKSSLFRCLNHKSNKYNYVKALLTRGLEEASTFS